MATTTGFWVRVQDDKVVAVWDTVPPFQSEAGWREAVDVAPELVAGREYITGHHFDLTATPAQIIWNKAELSVDDRKGGLVGQANGEFQQVVQGEIKKQTDEYPDTKYDAAVVEAARVVFEARRDAITAATTHEAVDAL